MALSRREFGKAVVAGVPFTAAIAATRVYASEPLRIGVSTSSFRDLPRAMGRDNVDEVIRALKSARVTDIELALANVEPAPPSTGPFRGGTPAYPRLIVLTPEEVAATNGAYRAELRMWRKQTPLSLFEGVREKLNAAGIAAYACAVTYDDSFTDDEIEITMRQVKALGASVVSSPMTIATAARLAPFAERHGLTVAIHNQVDGNSAAAIATGDLDKALALSPAFKLKLDIGNLTASNCDAVNELRARQARVSHVLVKDRLRNGGASQPFGEGDTPIGEVVKLLKASTGSIPVFVEYDYAGLRSSVEEVTTALAYTSRIAR
jgi:sugar phosphate isomerase/epimerase